MKTTIKLIAVAAALVLPLLGNAAEWPTKPVRVVLPSAAGSPPDVIARLLTDRLSQRWGRAVLVENKAGASGVIGMSAFKGLPHDQHSFVLVQAAVASVTPHIVANPRFDVDADLTPIAVVAISPMMVVARSDFTANTIAEVVAKAQQSSTPLTVGVNGQYSIPYLAAESIRRSTGLNANIVPFSSSGGAVAALMNGDVQLIVDGIPGVDPMLKAKRFKALAVSSAKRLPSEPNVPTLAESIKGASEMSGWFVLFGKKDAAPQVVAQVNKDILKVLEDPELISRFSDLGVQPRTLSPAQTAEFVAQERVRWSAIVKSLNIKPQ